MSASYLRILASTFPAPTPDSLAGKLQCLGMRFDEIAVVEFPTIAATTVALQESMHFLSHATNTINRKLPQLPTQTLEFAIHWTKTTDLVLWEDPPKMFYNRAILFSSFKEFVQWTGWRLQAVLHCPEDEVGRIRLELESLKVKVTSPRAMGEPAPHLQALTTELELL